MRDKFRVVVQIYPYPRRDVEITSTGIIRPIACLPDDAIYYKSGDDTICQAKGKGIGFALNVFAEDVRFFWGRIPQPGDNPTLFKPIIFSFFHPVPNSGEASRQDESERKHQYGAEVRLVLVFNFKESDLRQGGIGSKQRNGGKNAKWKEMFCKFLKPFE